MPRIERPAPLPSLVLTGIRHRNRVEIRIGAIAVPLTCSSYEILRDLVLPLVDSETGCAEIHPVAIRRLRCAIDETVGDGTALTLIETGMNGPYRLEIVRAELSERVALTLCFFELVDLKIVTEEQADALRAVLRVL